MFWDEKLIEHLGQNARKKYFGYKELTSIILEEEKSGKLSPGKSKTKPADWYEESRLYHNAVYPDTVPTSPEKRQYCKIVDPKTKKVVDGSYNPNQIPTLSPEYIDMALGIVKVQILRGGNRLATLLNTIAESAKVNDKEIESDILGPIQFSNSSE